MTTQIKNSKRTIVRISKTEYELDNGDVYPHVFELDDNITVELFQKLLDDSSLLVFNHFITSLFKSQLFLSFV
jgi:hypothetical protein